jgi:hypothetical protein
MTSAIRPHHLDLRLDDETWAELGRTAQGRGESVAEVVVYAVEQFLERAGFVPAWALTPLDARFSPSSGGRRRARDQRRRRE